MNAPDRRGLFPQIRLMIRELITGEPYCEIPEDVGDAIPEDEQEALRRMARNPDRAAFLSEVEAYYAEGRYTWAEARQELRSVAIAYEWDTCPICDGRVANPNGPGTVHCSYCEGAGTVTKERATLYTPCI